MTADLIITNTRVVTARADGAQAQAVAVAGNRIVAVGDPDSVGALAGPTTRIVNAAGGSVVPGLNDAHLHLQWWAFGRSFLDLREVHSLAEVRRLVSEAVAQATPGEVVRGRGWAESRLAGLTGGPTAADLDDVSGDVPVVLDHFSAHGAWLNSATMRRVGLTSATPDPDGGRFVRFAGTSEPTGEVHEAALPLVLGRLPAPSPEQRASLIADATTQLARRGITSVTDPVCTPDMVREYVGLRNADRLGVRLGMLLHWSWPSVQTPREMLATAMEYVGSATGLGDDRLFVSGCKLFADGVVPLHSSWMRTPYPDGSHGCLVTEGDTDDERLATLREQIMLLHRNRFRAQVHATGDAGCDAVVEAFADAMAADPWADARHVLIHANLPSAASRATMARLGIIASTNSLIRWQNGLAARGHIPEQAWLDNMPAADLLADGVVLSDASDAPIAEPDWAQALYGLVTRRLIDGTDGGAAQRISRLEALRSWTAGPAYQDYAESWKGTIEVGKVADLVVLDQDLMAIPDEELPSLTPVMTLLDGAVVHEA